MPPGPTSCAARPTACLKTAPGAPISPNKWRNTLIGVAVGVVLACIVAILMELIDTTIKNDDDLSAIYKIPVFAEIPDFENSGR